VFYSVFRLLFVRKSPALCIEGGRRGSGVKKKTIKNIHY
jgi:hypothetical protein